MADHPKTKHKTDRRKLLLLAVVALGAFVVLRRLRAGSGPAQIPGTADPFASTDLAGGGVSSSDLGTLQGEIDALGAQFDALGASGMPQTPGTDNTSATSASAGGSSTSAAAAPPPPASPASPAPRKPLITNAAARAWLSAGIAPPPSQINQAGGIVTGLVQPQVRAPISSPSYVTVAAREIAPATVTTPASTNLHRAGLQE